MQTFILTGTLISEQPLATCSKDLKDNEGGAGKPIPVPHTMTSNGDRLYFPATGIRGKLRRACRDLIRDHVIAATGNSTPFTLDQHYLLTLGGVKGTGTTDKASVAVEAYWRGKNPLLSVFGGGDAGVLGFLAGHLSVGNAICEANIGEKEAVLFSGARTDEFYRDKAQVQYLSASDLDALVMRAEGNRDSSVLKKDLKKLETALKAAKKSKDTDEEAKIQTDMARLQAEIGNVQDESGTGAVSVGMPLAGWKAIPQGQTLTHRMHLLRSNEIELGLLLATLNRFAQAPLLGAHTALGCGLVSGKWDVCTVTDAGRIPLGEVSFEPFNTLVIKGEALDKALAAFTAHLKTGSDLRIPTIEIPDHA